MIANSNYPHSELESNVAGEYRAQGFEVIIQPKQADLPFDLGTYQPDILVKKSQNNGYIVEVKGSVSRLSIDRYREISEMVAAHPGWSFLLVTSEDEIPLQLSRNSDQLMSWSQISRNVGKATNLISLGECEGAFLILWGALEATLRQHAKDVLIPIERFPGPSLINHLYSQGELSIEQYDQARDLQKIRNPLVHGYQTSNVESATQRLRDLVIELVELWGK